MWVRSGLPTADRSSPPHRPLHATGPTRQLSPTGPAIQTDGRFTAFSFPFRVAFWVGTASGLDEILSLDEDRVDELAVLGPGGVELGIGDPG